LNDSLFSFCEFKNIKNHDKQYYLCKIYGNSYIDQIKLLKSRSSLVEVSQQEILNECCISETGNENITTKLIGDIVFEDLIYDNI
jgi:hypothetical protein